MLVFPRLFCLFVCFVCRLCVCVSPEAAMTAMQYPPLPAVITPPAEAGLPAPLIVSTEDRARAARKGKGLGFRLVSAFSSTSVFPALLRESSGWGVGVVVTAAYCCGLLLAACCLWRAACGVFVLARGGPQATIMCVHRAAVVVRGSWSSKERV